jgi:hypothetical protein
MFATTSIEMKQFVMKRLVMKQFVMTQFVMMQFVMTIQSRLRVHDRQSCCSPPREFASLNIERVNCHSMRK